MPQPSERSRAELDRLIGNAGGRLGEVHRLTKRGLNPDQIAKELGVSTSGFVSNNRIIANSILDGTMPSGSTMVDHVLSRIRTLLGSPGLTDETRSYLSGLLRDFADAARTARSPRAAVIYSSPEVTPTVGEAPNLRAQLDAEVRERVRALVKRIGDPTQLDADDYQTALVAAFALDVVARLAIAGPLSRTTRLLHERRRLDLSLEQALVDWAEDLPVMTNLVEEARGRLDYWRSQ